VSEDTQPLKQPGDWMRGAYNVATGEAPSARPGEYRSVMLRRPALNDYLGYAPINAHTEAWDSNLNTLAAGGWRLVAELALDGGWVLLTWQKEEK
jgi:hypothetical protein